MNPIDRIEEIDNVLSDWEDYFHGKEGEDVTITRFHLKKIKEHLNKKNNEINVNYQKEKLREEYYKEKGHYHLDNMKMYFNWLEDKFIKK